MYYQTAGKPIKSQISTKYSPGHGKQGKKVDNAKDLTECAAFVSQRVSEPSELKKKRELESTWKSLSSTIPAGQTVAEAEEAWLAQKSKVSKMFAEHKHHENKKI